MINMNLGNQDYVSLAKHPWNSSLSLLIEKRHSHVSLSIISVSTNTAFHLVQIVRFYLTHICPILLPHILRWSYGVGDQSSYTLHQITYSDDIPDGECIILCQFKILTSPCLGLHLPSALVSVISSTHHANAVNLCCLFLP